MTALKVEGENTMAPVLNPDLQLSCCPCIYMYILDSSSLQTSSDYDHLMLMQKVEVFEQAIEHTSGDDLAKVLWLNSPSSEVLISEKRILPCA